MNKKEFIKTLIDMGGCGAKTETWDRGWDDAIGEVIGIAEELDEPEKVVVPQFVADWIDVHNLYGNNPLREYRDLEIDFNEGWANEKDAEVYHWVNKNPYAFIDALRYGYSPSLRAASINIGKAIQEGIDMVNQPSHYKGKHGLEILFEHFATKVEELEE